MDLNSLLTKDILQQIMFNIDKLEVLRKDKERF